MGLFFQVSKGNIYICNNNRVYIWSAFFCGANKRVECVYCLCLSGYHCRPRARGSMSLQLDGSINEFSLR